MSQVVLFLAMHLAFDPSSAISADWTRDFDLLAYRVLCASTGRDGDSQVRLALWCEARGMMAECRKHLAIAVVRDRSHVAARGLLGVVSHRGRWEAPEAVVERLKSDEDHAVALSRYHSRRARSIDSADSQLKLCFGARRNRSNPKRLRTSRGCSARSRS